MQSVLEILRKTEAYFAKAGIESPKVDAEWLIAGTLGCKRLDIYMQFDRPLEDPVLEVLRERIKRRAGREPLQHILGTVDFHDIQLKVGKGALIPRAETEQLVEKILYRVRENPPARIVDLGTGTGAIALALAKALPEAKVLAIDASKEALNVARSNADNLGLRERVSFRSGDWLEGLDFIADCIVSNPPYLTEQEWREAAPEVREFEPKQALVAADEGMEDLKTIIRASLDRLATGGLLALEMGIKHGPDLKQFALDCGYIEVVVEQDDSRRDRFLFCAK